jgi:hypothetical protein
MTEKCKVDVPTTITPVIHNIGDERSESPLLVMCFPRELEVKRAEGWNEAIEISKYYRNFGSVWTLMLDFLNVDHYKGLYSMTISAKQAGVHKILIEVKDKSGKSEHELILESSV